MQIVTRPVSSRFIPAITLLAFAAACTSDERPPWPDDEPDIYDIKLVEGVAQVPDALVQKVKVQPGRLVFPKTALAEVQAAYPVGKPVIGGESTENPAENPFGFIRKVKSVAAEGEDVVVETEDATIAEVFQGRIRQTFDPLESEAFELPDTVDLDAYFPEYPVGEGSDPPEGGGAPLVGPPGTTRDNWVETRQGINDQVSISEALDGKGTITLLEINKSRTYGSGNKAVTVNFQGNATLESKLKFRPTLKFEFETTRLTLDYVHVSARGALEVENSLNMQVGVTAASGTEPTALVGLEELLEEGPEVGRGISKTIYKSQPIKGPRIYGVPTTFRVELVADCGYGIQAGMEATATIKLNADAYAGIEYHKDTKWKTLSNFSFRHQSNAQILAGGGVAVECGVSSRINWLVGDKGGPYLGLRTGIRAQAAYADACDEDEVKNHRPDGKAVLALKPFAQVQAGGKLDAWNVVEFEVGPWTLYSWPAENAPPILRREWTFPKKGLGYCIVPCDNKVKDGDETDLDCGGEECLPCTNGKACSLNTDCKSEACTNGACVGSFCEDGVVAQAETDVDCGGGTCDPCPGGRACILDGDCAEGFCGVYDRKCTVDLCQDGRRSGGEGDIDCGAPCATACASGKRCNGPFDCASGACSVTTSTCVTDACFDGQVSLGETDNDCGGRCATRCPIAARCAVDGDCQSAICHAYEYYCSDSRCRDGLMGQDESDRDCGGSCAKCAIGSGCRVDADCGSTFCHATQGRCVKDACENGRIDPGETAVDCGGPCGRCGLGKSCSTGSDCSSTFCGGSPRRCVESQCSNGLKDDDESDVDCGRNCGVYKCGADKACTTGADCQSGFCTDGRCSPDRCRDRVKNGAESDVDCGNACPGRACEANQACGANADCASGVCNTTSGRCASGACEDGLKSPGESDIDCGGACGPCAIGATCTTGTACASGTCNLVSGRCVSGPCANGVKDGNESDLDCGGTCDRKCAAGLSCARHTDCRSGSCTANGTCAADQCSDGFRNGNESDVDCGRSCGAGCAVDKGCFASADCTNPQGVEGAAGYCHATLRRCEATSCTTGVKDGAEGGPDCGGPDCAKCAVNVACTANADCASGFCHATRNVCVATACEDGRANAGESDVDCGGPCATTCAIGQGCNNHNDCAQRCLAGRCAVDLPRECYDDRANWLVGGATEIDFDGAKGPSPSFVTWCLPQPGGDSNTRTPGGDIYTYSPLAWTLVMFNSSEDLTGAWLDDVWIQKPFLASFRGRLNVNPVAYSVASGNPPPFAYADLGMPVTPASPVAGRVRFVRFIFVTYINGVEAWRSRVIDEAAFFKTTRGGGSFSLGVENQNILMGQDGYYITGVQNGSANTYFTGEIGPTGNKYPYAFCAGSSRFFTSGIDQRNVPLVQGQSYGFSRFGDCSSYSAMPVTSCWARTPWNAQFGFCRNESLPVQQTLSGYNFGGLYWNDDRTSGPDPTFSAVSAGPSFPSANTMSASDARNGRWGTPGWTTANRSGGQAGIVHAIYAHGVR